MTDLNKEAEEYASKLYYPIGDSESELNWVENNKALVVVGYIEAATNSKQVQSEKIKAQIEVLTNLQLHFDISKNDAVKRCETAINELEQQLKQLEP